MIASIFDYDALDVRVLDDCRLLKEAEVQRARYDQHMARVEEAQRLGR